MKMASVVMTLLVGTCLAMLAGACEEGEEEATAMPTAMATPTVIASPTASPPASPSPSAATPTTAPETPTATAPPTPSPTPTAFRPLERAYELVPVVEWATFDRMLDFSTIPGAETEAVVITQDGVIWRGSLEGGSSPTIFGDISHRLIESPDGEEGLLGLAFSPDFPVDGRVYLYYTAGNPRRSVLSRFQAVDGGIDVESERILLEIPQPFSNHNGGQLAFGPDGYLYVALGDGGSAGDPQGNAQNLSTLLGSILRLDVSGEGYVVPPDNPFVARAGARPEIYAYGLRNPWRFSFDKVTGDLWAGDVGQDRWEEVERIGSGGNYGWNIMEGLECYRSEGCDTAGLQMPRAVYGHDLGCAVMGGYVYRGVSMPELNGWYVYGDYCSGRIWAANTADDSPPVLLAETELLIASFGELLDGELVALTFAPAIYRLQRKA
jgi:glucose/arabinose dehydrogenase